MSKLSNTRKIPGEWQWSVKGWSNGGMEYWEENDGGLKTEGSLITD
jgi:hypothetical protein